MNTNFYLLRSDYFLTSGGFLAVVDESEIFRAELSAGLTKLNLGG
jgi:hypothetical protein